MLDNEEELSDEPRERTISIFKGIRQIFLLIKYLEKIQKIILNGALLNALMRKEESTER